MHVPCPVHGQDVYAAASPLQNILKPMHFVQLSVRLRCGQSFHQSGSSPGGSVRVFIFRVHLVTSVYQKAVGTLAPHLLLGLATSSPNPFGHDVPDGDRALSPHLFLGHDPAPAPRRGRLGSLVLAMDLPWGRVAAHACGRMGGSVRGVLGVCAGGSCVVKRVGGRGRSSACERAWEKMVGVGACGCQCVIACVNMPLPYFRLRSAHVLPTCLPKRCTFLRQGHGMALSKCRHGLKFEQTERPMDERNRLQHGRVRNT